MKRLLASALFASSIALAPLATAATAAESEAMARAQQLLKQKQPQAAYDLLLPLEESLAGEVDYDYLLGIAALDAGHPDMATLAFERVLAVDPNYAGARMDLARAYFDMGNDVAAKQQFDQVLGLKPPAHVRRVAEQYLAAIQQRAEAKLTKIRGYAAFTLGHDTNVNAGSDATTFRVPALVGTILDIDWTNDGRGADSFYAQLAAGGSIEHQIKPGLGVFGGVDASMRMLDEANQYEQDNLSGRVGLSFGKGDDLFKVSLNAGHSWLDDANYTDTLGLGASWQHIINRRNIATLFGQYTEVRYEGAGAPNDVDQSTLGGTWLHALDDDARRVVYASVYGGYEDAVNNRADGDKDFYGAAIGGQMAINGSTSVYASVGAQIGDYDKRNVAFLVTREDDLYYAKLGVNWVPAEDWSVQAELAYSQNDSNIIINDYDRTDVSVTVRRDFR